MLFRSAAGGEQSGGELELSARRLFQEDAEHDIAHRKACGWHVHIAIAHESAEFVIATAPGEGAEVVANRPGQALEFLRAEVARWAAVVKAAGLKAE